MTILFLHGHGSASDTFAALMEDPCLADTTRIAVDLRGHGKSPMPPPPSSEAWTRSAFAADVLEVLSGLGPEPKILVGHSMGVRVAVEVVASDPSAVDGLFCIDMDTRARKPGMLKLSKAPGAEAAAREFPDDRVFPSLEAVRSALEAHGYDEGRVEGMVESGRIHAQEDGSWWCGVHPHTFWATAGPDGPLVGSLRDAWEAVAAADHIPVSLVLAAKGSAARPSEVAWMAETMPRLHHVVVPHTRHSVHKDDTSTTASLLAEMVTAVRQAESS